MDVIKAALRAILCDPGSSCVDEIRRTFGTQSWTGTLDVLEQHRLKPATGEAIAIHDLSAAVPVAVSRELLESHRKTTLTNTVLFHTLARALKALDEHGVRPVVWKGIVLADSFYRDPGARWMGDVDLSIESDEVDAATEAFASIGLRRPPSLQTDDAVYFEHPAGIMFDVHHRVRLFEGYDADDITIDLTPQRCPAPNLRVLAPDAMLVHLVVHLDGHLHETGYVLSWLLDLALVLTQWGDRFDFAKVAEMMPDATHLVSLYRIAGFLQDMGVAVPTELVTAAADTPPLTLGEILRSRRLAEWDLPGLRGWARLGACRLGARNPEGRPWPRLSDLVCWPADVVRRRAARPAA
jgi:hypothetical protein